MFNDQTYSIRDKKGPSRTFISAKTIRILFNDKSRVKLLISNFNNAYNHYMRAVN